MAILALVFVAAACKDSGPFVIVDGKKITESDLQKEAGPQYDSLRREYNSKLLDLLKNLAEQRMIEKEAKEKNLSPQEYMQGVMNQVGIPSRQEIQSRYDELKKGGQINEPLAVIEPKLMDYMMREKKQAAMMTELARLRQKYNYDIYRTTVDVAGEPVRNNPSASITVVEFSDFECPYCIRAQTVNHALREKYGNKIAWVFKDFPLSFHQNAMGAHVAANCVLKQNQEMYWKYFDLLFSPTRTEATLAGPGLEAAAKQVGVNIDQFKACLENDEIKKEIQEDMAQGEALGVSGTPAFFINGRMISGAMPMEEFTALIDEEL